MLGSHQLGLLVLAYLAVGVLTALVSGAVLFAGLAVSFLVTAGFAGVATGAD